MDIIKQELYKLLYLENEDTSKLDETFLKKQLYLLIRECLKNRKYEVEIGPYKFNIIPKDLSIRYESEKITIVMSNQNIYSKSIRNTETRFFCISPTKKNEFLMDTPIIRVTGSVININGICEEHYLFELYTDEEDSIQNYIKLPKDAQIININLNPHKAMMITRKINKNDIRTDVIDFFQQEKVTPVFLDTIIEKYKALPDRKEYDPIDYRELLPSLEHKKKIVQFVYSSIIDFYSEYIKENQ